MRYIAKVRFMGPYTIDFLNLDGYLFNTLQGSLKGLRRERPGLTPVRVELVKNVPTHAERLKIPADLGTQMVTLTQRLEQVRELRVWAKALADAAKSTEVLIEDEREGLVKTVVTALRNTSNIEDSGILGHFQETLRYFGQVAQEAARTRAQNAAAAAEAEAAEAAEAAEEEAEVEETEAPALPDT